MDRYWLLLGDYAEVRGAMTHDELLAKINAIQKNVTDDVIFTMPYKALYAVVELHKCSNPRFDLLCDCGQGYPCATIKVIEKELG